MNAQVQLLHQDADAVTRVWLQQNIWSS
jgi:hypothetical protein